MNRQLKFRALDKETNSWYKPDFRGYAGKIHELLITFSGELARRTMNPTLEHESLFPDKYILMQYTGLKDHNGKEIYEGDIVRTVALSNDHHQRGAITVSSVEYWNGNACLSITFTPIFPFIVDHEIEVIGNIYEHPHLLEAST